jgi:hypothetical protein
MGSSASAIGARLTIYQGRGENGRKNGLCRARMQCTTIPEGGTSRRIDCPGFTPYNAICPARQA